MARTADTWCSVTQALIDEWKLARDTWPDYFPTGNVPPVDDESYRIFSETLNDAENRSRLYNPVVDGSVTYKMFIMTFNDDLQTVEADLLYLDSYWGNNFIVQGAWWFDGEPASAWEDPDHVWAGTALQIGMQYDYNTDEPPLITGIAGTPKEPLRNNLFLFMPDIVVYDENGDVVSVTPPTSNADLRDINLLLGQTPRNFAWSS